MAEQFLVNTFMAGSGSHGAQQSPPHADSEMDAGMAMALL